MLVEFFWHGTVSKRVWAWSGCAVIVAHALLRAYIKYLMNDWMGRFYDLGGSAQEVGSGETGLLEQGAERVTRLLLEFGVLCLPHVLVHPIVNLLTNRWILSWRVALVKAYLLRWGAVHSRIENGAQRIHEDTQRFARGLQTCMITVLDSVLTLAVFSPVLVDLGSELQPMQLPSSWLMMLCALVAAAGLLVSLALGWSLVALEVENQRVEADLRKQLVLYEHSKDRLETPELQQSVHTEVDPAAYDLDERDGERGPAFSKPPEPEKPKSLGREFSLVVDLLVHNYRRLYNKFAVFSIWLSAYEQFVVLLPYLIAGPLLFSQSNRITLGKVTKVSHAFGNVFDALNILSDRWIEVTDWLSVMQRLREFETMVYRRGGAIDFKPEFAPASPVGVALLDEETPGSQSLSFSIDLYYGKVSGDTRVKLRLPGEENENYFRVQIKGIARQDATDFGKKVQDTLFVALNGNGDFSVPVGRYVTVCSNRFDSYYLAYMVQTTGPNLTPDFEELAKKIADGKNQGERFQIDGHEYTYELTKMNNTANIIMTRVAA